MRLFFLRYLTWVFFAEEETNWLRALFPGKHGETPRLSAFIWFFRPRVMLASRVFTLSRFFILVLLAACAAGPQPEPWPLSGDFVDANGFVRSPNDAGKYLSLKLENGLEVLLIQSEHPRAGVTLDLRVGSADNPPEFPGLAHFLEHMLFLGTKKYPEPEGYQTFIRVNGGSYNASTGLDHTNYYFSIDAQKLPQAMDRLARFFIAPLFTRAYVDRELEIIEAEYRRSLDSEGRSLFFATTRLYNQEHPAARFTAGNRQSLLANGRDALYQALKDFYKRYYRPGRMRLVVVGNQPLAELEHMTRSAFGAIAAQPPTSLPPRPALYNQEDLPELVEVKSKSERYSLDYRFPLPNQDKHYFSKPAGYVAHLLGHEAPGSLLAWLRERNWASSLSAGTSSIGDDYAMRLRIGLTREGNRHLAEIHHALFAYIRLVRERAHREPWRYKELARMGEIDFRWREAGDPLSQSRSMARLMHYVPADQVFRATSLYSGFDAAQVEEVLLSLRQENAAITHIAPDRQFDTTDPYYHTRYRITRLAPDFAGRGEPPQGLRLPEANPYIPGELQVGKLISGEPRRIEHPGLNAWLYQDARFGVPRASISISISQPGVAQSPADRMLLSIYQRAMQREFEQEFYAARLANQSFQLYTHSRGITLRTQGYDSALPSLFGDMLERLTRWELAPETFAHFKTELEIAINNEQTDRTVSRLYRRLLVNRLEYQWDFEQRREAISRLGYHDWLALRRSLIKEASERTLLAHGELTEQQMRELATRSAALFASPLISVDPPRVVAIDGPMLVNEPVREGQQSLVLAFVYANLAPTPRNQLLTRLAANYLGGPFFHYMRTENKLGYQASVSNYDLLDNPGLIMLVESNSTQPQALYAYFARFFSRMREADLDDATFAQLASALEADLTAPPLRLNDESGRIWYELFRRNHAFDTREQWLAQLRRLEADDLRVFIRQFLDPANRANRLWAYSGETLRLP